MFKKSLVLLVVLVTVLLAAFTGCSNSTTTPAATTGATTTAAATTTSATITAAATTTSAAASEVIELSFPWGANFSVSEQGATIENGWCKWVEEKSNGRVKFNKMIGALPEGNMYDAVLKGAYDVACNPIMHNTGRFPVLEAMCVPVFGTVCAHPSKAAWDAWQQSTDIQNEFSEVQLIAVWASSPSPPGVCFGTTSKAVRTLEDLKGMKMGNYGEWGTKEWTALGAVPVAVPPPALYENMQRKIVDGSSFDAEMLTSFNLQDVVKYLHAVGSQFVPFWLVMNKDTWNSLPSDIQTIMMEAGSGIPDVADTYHGDMNSAAIERAKSEKGLEVIEYSAEELAKWQAATAPVMTEFIQSLNTKGYDGQAIFDMYKNLEAKYAQ